MILLIRGGNNRENYYIEIERLNSYTLYSLEKLDEETKAQLDEVLKDGSQYPNMGEVRKSVKWERDTKPIESKKVGPVYWNTYKGMINGNIPVTAKVHTKHGGYGIVR